MGPAGYKATRSWVPAVSVRPRWAQACRQLEVGVGAMYTRMVAAARELRDLLVAL
jgi:hypothetical protein